MNALARTSHAFVSDVEILSNAKIRVGDAANLRLEIIQDEAGFLALQSSWDALVDLSASRSPFLRWDWISLWWEQMRDSFELAVGVVRASDDKVLAIAPLVLGHVEVCGRSWLRQLGFLGSFGKIASQRLDFIVPCGGEASLTPVLCKVFSALRPHWDCVRLNMLPEESPNLPFIFDALNRCGSGTGVLNRHPSRYLKLPSTWLDYEMMHSGAWRSKLRRKWKAMENLHHGRTLIAGRDCPADAAMQMLAQLHENRFPEGMSDFLDERSQRFHLALARRWIPQGRAILPYIEIEGKAVGAMYGYLDGDSFFQYQMGWDPCFREISMGMLVMAWCMRCAIDRGVSDYDTLPGEFSYKESWCPETRHMLDVEAFNPLSARALAFRFLRVCKRILKTKSRQPAPQENVETGNA